MSDEYEFAVDASRFPLVRVVLPPLFAEGAVDASCERMARVAARGRFAGVFDTRRLRFLRIGAKERAYFAAASGRWNAEHGRATLVAESIVVANRAVRAMVTAFLWMRPTQTVATEVFPTTEQATDWATARLHAAGLHVATHSARAPA